LRRMRRASGCGAFLRAMAALCCLCAGDAWADPAASAERRKDQIEKIETDLLREREQYLKFDEREKELLEQLSGLEREIAEKRKSLGELEGRIALSKPELAKLREKLGHTERSLKGIEERLAGRLVAFYKYAKRGYVRVLATSKDLDDLSRKIQYLRIIMRGDRGLFQETTALQQKHKQEFLLVREKLASIERMERETSERLLSIKEDMDRKVLVLMKIHKEREFYETGVKELESAAKGLRETLLHLDKGEPRQRDLPSHFASARGKLPLPSPGKIIRGERSGADNGLKGVLIACRSGAEVKAVFPGRVDFSGNLRGYGEIIVVNHGSRFFTVTAYLSKRKREEGEMVKAGDVIGLLGKEGTSSDARLYFEIRHGAVNLDPLEWLKVH
jgi:septal ring factor EnvC (AmiA/AmiB activator)